MNELVEKAKASYQTIREVLTEIGNTIKEKNSSFSIEILLKQFSLMMQAIMLRQIAADGVIKHEERLFIRELCNKYDLLEICKEQEGFTFKSISWEHLENFTSKTMNLLCEEIDEIVNPLEDEMTFYIALVESVSNKQYYKIFFSEMSTIFTCLNYIDDDLDEAEKNETISSFLDHFITRYKYFYKSMKRG